MVELAKAEEKKALRLHREALVVDTHCDTIMQLMPQQGRGAPPPRRLGERSDRGHIVDLVGVEHVGLGSDFDGIGSTPEGLEDVSKMPNITRELVRRGHSDEEIEKVLGGNHLRVLKEVMR